MRIAFFGLPLAALLLREDGHDLTLAALCRRRSPGERRLRRVLGPRRVVVTPRLDDPAFVARVHDARPDLVVSWFWTTRIPPSVLAAARSGAFGVHPSLLPRHRGPDPYFWAIDAGDEETGVTAHRLAEDYDTGAILARRALRVDPSWNAWTLAKKLDRPSLALLREVARAFAEGRPPAEVPQDEALATSAPSPDDADLEIDWTWPAARVARRVRAASPSPGAFTFLGEAEVTLLRVAETRAFPRALAPGEAAVVARADGARVAVVRAADVAVELHAGLVHDDASDAPRELDAAGLAALVAAARGDEASAHA